MRQGRCVCTLIRKLKAPAEHLVYQIGVEKPPMPVCAFCKTYIHCTAHCKHLERAHAYCVIVSVRAGADQALHKSAEASGTLIYLQSRVRILRNTCALI